MKISKTLFRAMYSEMEDLFDDFKAVASCTCSCISNPEHYENVWGSEKSPIQLRFVCKYPGGDLSKDPYDMEYYLIVDEDYNSD